VPIKTYISISTVFLRTNCPFAGEGSVSTVNFPSHERVLTPLFALLYWIC